MLLLPVFDVRVDEEGVHLAVDVLDGDLEAVEAAGLLWSRGGAGGRESGGREGGGGVDETMTTPIQRGGGGGLREKIRNAPAAESHWRSSRPGSH